MGRPVKLEDLRAMLARGRPVPPIVLLIGPEPYFKEEAIDLIAAALGQAAEGQLSRVSVDAASQDLDALIETQLTPSLFGGEKLVLVRNLDRARAPARRSFLETLGRSRIPPGIRLVLSSDEMRSAPPELPGEAVLAVVFYVPWKSELLTWIGQRLTQLRVRHSRGVAELLYTMHGKAVPWKSDLEVDVFRLAASIERLARHVAGGDGAPIDEEAVRQVLGAGAAPDVFRLVDLVAGRRGPAAMEATRRYLEDGGESALGLVALLLDRFEKLLRVKAASSRAPGGVWSSASAHARECFTAFRSDAKKRAQAALASEISAAGGPLAAAFEEVKEFQRAAVVIQADRYSVEELAVRFRALVELDRKLKSGGGDERTELEVFVARG